jgi:ribosomal protein S8
MDIRLLVREIATILRQNGYISEATSLENSEYGATGNKSKK